MSYKIQIPPKIQDKIKTQALLIAEDKPLAALQWYDHVYEKIHSLGELPHRCPLVPENVHFDFELRHLLIGNHRILFYVEEKTVVILDFKGGRQNKPG